MALNDSMETHWIGQQFSDDVYELTTQTAARLRVLVEFTKINAEKMLLDRVGSAEVQVINNRHQLITPSELLWDRRALTTERVGIPFFLDKRDAQRVLGEPKSVYAKRAAQAMERDLDRMIITALDAAVFTGKNGTTSVSAATDGVVTVDGTGGFTYDLMLEIDSNFLGNEVGTEMPVEKYLLISEQEHLQMMKEAELISGDFSHQYVVDKGEIKRAMGYNIIVFGSQVDIPMLTVASAQRTCFAVCKGAVTVGMPGSWEAEWQPRNDRWTTDQLLVHGERGAVRMEGLKVQKITTTAT